MKTVYSPDHVLHQGQLENDCGQMIDAYERPERAEAIVARIEELNLGPILAAAPQDLAFALKTHEPRFVHFLQIAYHEWLKAGRSGPCVPSFFRVPGMSNSSQLWKEPVAIDGRLGFWSFDAGCAIVEGSWKAIKAGYDTVLSAASLLAEGEKSVFSLNRPPGHHAGRAFMGGYCYLNNAAIAVAKLQSAGAQRIAVVDIDYHHGNGTQDIFYDRGDVLVVNIHADPLYEYPFFAGFHDEIGKGIGEGFNLNLPLSLGTKIDAYLEALETGCNRVSSFAPDALVVSLGVDTYENDPIGGFKIKTIDYPIIGAHISKLNCPTLFVLEGGYAIPDIGPNVVGVLKGFLG